METTVMLRVVEPWKGMEETLSTERWHFSISDSTFTKTPLLLSQRILKRTVFSVSRASILRTDTGEVEETTIVSGNDNN